MKPIKVENDTTEYEVELYQQRTGIQLDAHSKGTLRDMIRKENTFWDKEAVREDSNNSPVEGYYEIK